MAREVALFESRNGIEPVDHDIQKARDGFDLLGYETQYFLRSDMDRVVNRMDKPVVVGTIDGMKQYFNAQKCMPKPMDYPASLRPWVRRNLRIWNLKNAIAEFKSNGVPMFLKPVDTKVFDGIPVSHEDHLHYFKGLGNPRVWISPIVDIVSEWRCYVHKGEMVHASNYSGDCTVSPDWKYVKEMVGCHHQPPDAYTLDVAVLKDGSNDLIEANDFWAIGSYSLDPVKYAEMLRDRFMYITFYVK